MPAGFVFSLKRQMPLFERSETARFTVDYAVVGSVSPPCDEPTAELKSIRLLVMLVILRLLLLASQTRQKQNDQHDNNDNDEHAEHALQGKH